MLAKIELTMDCSDAVALAAFWRDAVGYADVPPPAPFATQAEYLATTIDEDTDDGLRVAYLYDPDSNAPSLCLLEVPEPKTVKNRMHFDLVVSGQGPPGDQWQRVTDEVGRLRDLGASVLAEFTRHHVTMADPEGNEFDVT